MIKEEDKAMLEHMQYELSNQIGSKYCRRKYEAVTRAIKAIESEPCEDCVSIQEVKKFVEYIQTIKDNHNEKGSPINYGTICDIVIKAHRLLDSPPVTPVHEWIPVSEKLPLERNVVLVWSEYNGYCCAYLKDGKWYINGMYDAELKSVTAWIDFPKLCESEVEE